MTLIILQSVRRINMSLIDSYDDSEEIVKAEILTMGQKRLPKTAIVCFKKELIDIVEREKVFEKYSEINVCGEEINIYKTKIGKEEIVLYRTLVGGPATTSMMEEIHARGVENFIFFGSCGELTSDMKKGAFIIPTEAYRDEGTSYHYMPVSDFVEIKTATRLAEIFKKKNIEFELTRTWTTDALYKETKHKVKKRVEKGCKVVEMECASIMAVANSRNINAYQFLYSDDTLAGEIWDRRTLKEDRSFILKECLKIAIEIIKEI